MPVNWSERGLEIDGVVVPMLSGSMHYWRVARALWDDCLQKVRALGLRLVCTYVPWSVHEIEEGRFDFGDIAPEKDLREFLRLVKKNDLFAIVRPGPHINAEISGFGFPDRILNNERIQAQGPEGAPVILPVPPMGFPVPSYASEKFWKELGPWFDVVAEQIAPHLHPRGPVVMVQCDNECSYFFRTGAFEQDYSDGARTSWKAYLKRKYPDPRELQKVHHTTEAGAVGPPTRFRASRVEDLRLYLDWAEFKERMLGDALSRIRTEWESRGVREVVFSHNVPPSSGRTPFHIERDERALGTVGMDFYHQRTEHAVVKSRVMSLEGQTRLAWSPEFGAGCYQAWAPIDLDDHRFITPYAMMWGLRGFNWYMIVERERWYGSPITRRGGIRKDHYAFYADFVALVQKHRLFDFRRQTTASVVVPRIYDRLSSVTNVFAQITPMPFESRLGWEGLCREDRFGMTYAPQIEHERMSRAFLNGLEAVGVTVRTADGSDGEIAGPSRAIFCPGFEFMDRALQDRLVESMRRGCAVVIGPEAPSRDELMNEYAAFEGFLGRPIEVLDCSVQTLVFAAGAGKLVLVNGPLAPGDPAAMGCVAAIARHLGLAPEWSVDAPCERTIWRDGERTLIYVANPTDDPRVATMQATTPARLKDLHTGEELCGDEAIRIAMPAWTVRIFQLAAGDSPC